MYLHIQQTTFPSHSDYDLHDIHQKHGFYILAFDGSDINIPRDLDDKETLIQNGTNKPFNQYHLNALYDVLNERYWDIDLRTASKIEECDAFIHILHEGRYPENAIALFDRGFESYNLFAHCIEKKQKFAVRVKDMTSNGMLSSMDLPEGEWDQDITMNIMRLPSGSFDSRLQRAFMNVW